MWKAVILLFACVLSGCATGPAVNSEDSRMADFITRLKPSFPGVKRVSTEVSTEVAGAGAGARGDTHCHIVVDKTYFEKGVSDVELAFVLAHEMAHCDAKHNDTRRLFVDKTRFWEQEMFADKMAIDATRNAGLGDVSVLAPADLPFFLRESYPASGTHPGGAERLSALKGAPINGLGLFVREGRIVIGKSPI